MSLTSMMTRVRHIIDRLNANYGTAVGVTIVLLSLWQLLVAMFGVDLCDSGYYLTFFDNIFKAPQTVEYNFMYYLSGVVGGAISAVLPATGKWLAMRVAGVLCNVGVMVLLAVALRRIVPATAVVLGYLMVVASLTLFPYTFNNDLLSVLLWVAALVLSFKGLRRGSLVPLLLSGVLVGMNIFARIPNVLAVGLVVMPFVANAYYKRGWPLAWKQCGTFVLGLLLGVLAVIGLMSALGHWDVFKQNMTDLMGIATGNSGQASHNVGGMVGNMFKFYMQCLMVSGKGLVLWLLFWLIRRIKIQPLRIVAWVAVAAVLCYFMWRQSHIMHPLWIMCVVGCVAMIVEQGNDRRMAAWLGLFMLLVFPLGSDGATNNGGIIAWMAAPVAAVWWQRRSNVIFPLVFIAVGLMQTLLGSYFDGGSLRHKTATVNDARAAFIHTVPERAQALNSTLPELRQLVGEGDTLLCYGSIPMMNHLTVTRPAMGCSWPELLSAEALQARLDALQGTPRILRQKFDTLCDYWSEPSDDYLTQYPSEDKFRQQRKMDIFNQFVQDKGYRVLWQNKWFVLYGAEN